MFQNMINLVKSIFKKKPQTSHIEERIDNRFSENYNDSTGINIYAMIANSIAGVIVNESEVTVTGDNARANALNQLTRKFVKNKFKDATADAGGNGGMVIVPNYVNGIIGEDVIPQNRVVVNAQHNGVWTDVVIIVDIKKVDENFYFLLRNMLIENGVYREVYKATQGDVAGNEVAISVISEWSNIRPITQYGTGIVMDRLPLAFVKCPTSDRNMNFTKGVPLTYGQDEVIKNIKLLLSDFMTEIKNKRSFIGVDDRLLDNTYDNSGNLIRSNVPESGVFKILQGTGDGKEFFQIFDPAFRDSSYIQAIDYWFRMLERGVGVSEGFFTQPKTAAPTATEVKSRNYDTFILQSAFRKTWENAFEDLVYAYNVLMNYYGITPIGEYELSFNWSYDLIENTDIAFSQQMQAQSIGALSTAEVRQWIKPDETIEQAEIAVQEIQASQALEFGDVQQIGVQEDAEQGELIDQYGVIDKAEDVAMKQLNGAQTQSLIAIISQYAEGKITIGQAINIVSVSIGVTKEEAKKIIEGSI